jgi:hypothetical protein
MVVYELVMWMPSTATGAHRHLCPKTPCLPFLPLSHLLYVKGRVGWALCEGPTDGAAKSVVLGLPILHQ